MFFRSVSRIYLTLVDTNINGDAFFPALDKKIWVERYVSKNINENGLTYQFLTLEKSR
jgi:dihydrofolate reductase